jgi:hypothetical protein
MKALLQQAGSNAFLVEVKGSLVKIFGDIRSIGGI